MDVEQIPVVLDIEASCFGRGSYPIEIGVTMSDGKGHCYLIRPQDDWTHWEQEAESLHSISRDTLLRFGWDVEYVARRLNHYLHGRTIYSDAWSYDSGWLALLFDSAGILQHFRIEHLVKVTSEAQLGIWEQTKQQVIEESTLQRHRASVDARIIQTTWLRTRAVCHAAAM